MAEPDNLFVSIDNGAPVAWADFCADNAEALDAAALADILAHIRRDGMYVCGGGAAGAFTLAWVLPEGSVDAERDAALDVIAARQLGLCNLAQKGSDRADFREVAVWQVKAALDAAYEAGRRATCAARDRAPDCTTSRAAAIAGVISNAVMAGEMPINASPMPDSVNAKWKALGRPVSHDSFELIKDFHEGFRIAGLMISARARASVRTPSRAALSGAEAALALAEDALDDRPEGEELPDAHAVLASIRDTLRAGLAPLHAAEGQAPYDAGLPGDGAQNAAGPSA